MNIWVIMLLVMVLSWIIQTTLQSKFKKYSRVPSPHGLTGADIARLMLKQNGITDVQVQSVAVTLTDHYNPTNKTINMSESVYSSASTVFLAKRLTSLVRIRLNLPSLASSSIF